MIARRIRNGVILLVVLAGCSPQPPSVRTSADVDRLDPTTWSIKARKLPDDQLGSLARLKELRILDFSGGWGSTSARITDDGLTRLRHLDLPKLETLTLGWCDKITDAGLDDVAPMNTITWLGLPACPGISDAGLPKLTASKSLTGLDLRGCVKITDAGIQQLAVKQDWKEISLGGCVQQP